MESLTPVQCHAIVEELSSANLGICLDFAPPLLYYYDAGLLRVMRFCNPPKQTRESEMIHMNQKEKKIMAVGMILGAVMMCLIFISAFLLSGQKEDTIQAAAASSSAADSPVSQTSTNPAVAPGTASRQPDETIHEHSNETLYEPATETAMEPLGETTGRQPNETETDAPAETSAKTSAKTSAETPAKTPAETSRLPEPSQDTRSNQAGPNAWDKASIYHGGDEVIYNGKIYRAKWWTQGELPGNADVWEDTLIAALGTVMQPSEAVHPSAPQEPGLAPSREPSPTPSQGPSLAPSQESSLAPSQGSSLAPSQTPGRAAGTKVVAYYPSWRTDQSKLRYDIVTHVVYAFAIPTAEGGLRPLEAAEQVPALIQSAHSGQAKVLLGVGGWSYNDVPLESTFLSATQTPERTAAFADAIVAMCDAYGFDGVDMDWEHPRVDGSSARQYEDLMLILAEKLHSKGKLLTSAVISGATADGNIYYDAAAHSDKVLSAVDWIHVMAYDGGDGERHSGYEFALHSARYWRDTRQVPAEKVVLGVPFYSRPGWASYGDILAVVPSAKDADHVNYNGMEVWYNGPDTIRKKAAYAAEQLGGIMIWEITQDTAGRQNSLLDAIGEAILK